MPWQASWKNAGGSSLPLRGCGIPYRGVNILLLWMAAQASGFNSPIWLTFKQALALGGCVRKGEKGTAIVYAGTRTIEQDATDQADEAKAIPFLKGYTVFNVDQIDGLPSRYLNHDDDSRFANPKARIWRVENFVNGLGATISYGGNRAYLNRLTDAIQMPAIDDFTCAEAFYATLCHELVHWTQQTHRLDRVTAAKQFEDSAYASLELEAEIGAAYLSACFGFAPFHLQDHAAYIGDWLTALKGDKRAIFAAASNAQKAVDYLLEIACMSFDMNGQESEDVCGVRP